MKNLIVEVSGRYAVVLTDTGDFRKIANPNNLKVGEVFTDKAKKPLFAITRTFAAIAAALVLCFMAGFYYMNYTAQGYIDVRINPGISLTLNAMNKVISMEGINDDGRILLEGIKQKESDPQKAVELIVSKAAELGYFTGQNQVRITVAVKDQEKTAGLESSLLETARNTLEVNSVSVPVSAFSIDVTDYKKLREERDEADDKNESTDYSAEWKNKTVKPSICDVKFKNGNIIIEFNHNLSLDNARVYAFPDRNPDQRLEASVIEFKNDKLTVSFTSLEAGEAYRLEATGLATRNGTLLDPISARIVQPLDRIASNDGPGDGKGPGSDDGTMNGKGAVNGSINGNFRNEEGKGNGHAFGLEKKEEKNREKELKKEQEEGQEREPGDKDSSNNRKGNDKSNQNNNSASNRNKNNPGDDEDDVDGVDSDDDEDVDSDEDEDEIDDDAGYGATGNRNLISSVYYENGLATITFNTDLSLEGAKVIAAPVNNPDRKIEGLVMSHDSRSLVVSFPGLTAGATYRLRIESAALNDGTKLDALEKNFKYGGHGNSENGNSEKKQKPGEGNQPKGKGKGPD